MLHLKSCHMNINLCRPVSLFLGEQHLHCFSTTIQNIHLERQTCCSLEELWNITEVIFVILILRSLPCDFIFFSVDGVIISSSDFWFPCAFGKESPHSCEPLGLRLCLQLRNVWTILRACLAVAQRLTEKRPITNIELTTINTWKTDAWHFSLSLHFFVYHKPFTCARAWVGNLSCELF